MKQSSVSPDLWETMVPQPFFLAKRCALMDSVTERIWLLAVMWVQFSQSSWSKGSSMEVMGNSLQKSRYIWHSFFPSTFWDPSLFSVLKSRS